MSLLRDARERYLDITQDQTDLYKIAETLGIDYRELYRAFAKEKWLNQRRQKLQNLDSSLVPAEQKNPEIMAIRRNLFTLDVELIDRTHQLLEYLDDLMSDKKLGGKEAVQYLKLLSDISERVQKSIDKAVGQAQGDDIDAQKLLDDLRTKVDALKALQGKKQTGLDLDRRRQAMRGFDEPEPK